MRINCPHCGLRDLAEFTYQGDASRALPELSAQTGSWNAHVYDRENPAGLHREHWQHSGGCRAHLRIERDTLSHAVSEAVMVRPSPPVKNQPIRSRGRK